MLLLNGVLQLFIVKNVKFYMRFLSQESTHHRHWFAVILSLLKSRWNCDEFLWRFFALFEYEIFL